MNKKRIRIIGAVTLLSLIGAFVWWAKRDTFLYAGTIEAVEVTLSARVSSVIEAMDAKEGHDVDAGQVLVRLGCEDLRLAADIARKDFDRSAKLRESGSISQEAFDRAKNRRDDTQLRIDWCTIKAPRAGTILSTHQEAGELVNPGTRLLTLADLSEVEAVIYVAQPMLARLKLNQEVTATTPELPGRNFRGRIAHIRQEAEFTPKNVQTREERTHLVHGIKIKFPNADRVLKPGMTVEVQL